MLDRETIDVPGELAQAAAEDILIVAYTPGSGGNFGLSNNKFDSVAYRMQLDKLDTMPSFNAAVAGERVFCYIGDEPNLEGWKDTWTRAVQLRRPTEQGALAWLPHIRSHLISASR